jgi:hydrogenase small subunit
MSVLGATSPRLEELLAGGLTHIPRVEFIHLALSLESGDQYIEGLKKARLGELDPFILVLEGSLFDERLAGDGSFSSLGRVAGRTVSVEDWVAWLAPRAAAVIAIGTCATWGGIPAALGNTTGAMGLQVFLGKDFRSRTGLPIVNVPGCAPNGDAFVELLSYVLLHLGGLVPLDLDELNRPRWLYTTSTPLRPARVPTQSWEERDERAECSVPVRGWINHIGGCALVGGACNGCTRPDFPDRTLPVIARHTAGTLAGAGPDHLAFLPHPV